MRLNPGRLKNGNREGIEGKEKKANSAASGLVFPGAGGCIHSELGRITAASKGLYAGRVLAC